MKNNFKP